MTLLRHILQRLPRLPIPAAPTAEVSCIASPRPAPRLAVRSALLCAALLPTALASGTATWEMNSYNDFIKGKFKGLSLSREGRLSLAPKVDTVFTSDQPVIWSVAQTSDGTLYAATGHRGRVYKIDKAGKSSLVWTAPEPEIFALAVDRTGAIYAATSPDGKVYRIENGTGVLHPTLDGQRRSGAQGVREPKTARVESNQPAEGRQAPIEAPK